MAIAPPYVYAATVVRVVDGDTVRLDVDLGFRIWTRNQSFRLDGCNAREVSEPGGKEARDNLARLLPVGASISVHSISVDKYGDRFDAQIVMADGTDLVSTLVAQQWAAPWDGRGTRPVPPWPRTV